MQGELGAFHSLGIYVFDMKISLSDLIMVFSGYLFRRLESLVASNDTISSLAFI
jgi:hypothetical protein